MGGNISYIREKFEEKYKKRKVLYAADCGSRTFGWAHEGSDFDVHIIYVHRDFEFYVRLFQDIRENLHDQFFTPDGIEVNIAAYDLRYFFRLYAKSNPCVNIMFVTPSQYFFEGFENFFGKSGIQKDFLLNYNIATIFNSYVRLMRENFRKHIMGREHVRVKSYIYLLHHLLLLKHIHKHYEFYESKERLPPIEFDKLLSDLECNEYIRKEIDTLISLKRNYREDEEEKKEEFSHLKGSVRLFTKRRKVLEVWMMISRRKLLAFIRPKRGTLMPKELSEKLYKLSLCLCHPELTNLM